MSIVSTSETTEYIISPSPSKFTYEDLLKLNNKSTSYLLKLAVIGHIDLNAFFAQVEQVRLNLSIDDPVVCVQWQAVIAVSYAARKYGIGRMDTVETCKRKCPHVILAHAAVYEKGSVSWKYLEKLPFQGNCKVSLDPYRRESRKIFRILAANCDLTEKASVDEGYLDLGRIIYHKLITMFPYLQKTSSGKDDDNDQLPSIPQNLDNIKFKGHVITAVNENDPIVLKDWDDIISLIGSNVIYDIRKEIYDQLGYTTSAGLSRNKNMAKLAGGFLKPDNQTIILNQLVDLFLQRFELTDVNGMGGKNGETILSTFRVPGNENSIKYLRNLPAQDLNNVYPNLYEIVTGNYCQQLRDRVDIKSMMSRKQLMTNNPIRTLYDSLDWIKTFVGDLCNRINDLDEEKAILTRPKTISVNVVINRQSHSKQCSITVFKDLKRLEYSLINLSLKLVIELIQEFYDLSKLNNGAPDFNNINPKNKVNIPPVSNFAVIVSNLIRLENSLDLFTSDKKIDNSEKLFKDLEMEQKLKETIATNTKKENHKEKLDKSYINNLFAKFEQDKLQQTKRHEIGDNPTDGHPITKGTKLDKEYINGLFQKFNEQETNVQKLPLPPKGRISEKLQPPVKKTKYNIVDVLKQNQASRSQGTISPEPSKSDTDVPSLDTHYCDKCNQTIDDALEHNDYHFALELSKQFQ